MEQTTNPTHDRTESAQPTVGENVADELSRLRDRLSRLAQEVRMKSKGASDEIQNTREVLEKEVKRFSDEVQSAAGDTRDDLQEVGQDLQARLQGLANQIGADSEAS